MVSSLESRNLLRSSKKPAHAHNVKGKAPSDKKWQKKMQEKEKMQRIRSLSQKLKDDFNLEQQKAAESRKANRDRKAENEKKNMVVQVIKNEKAIKKLSPKHRRAARIYMLHELN